MVRWFSLQWRKEGLKLSKDEPLDFDPERLNKACSNTVSHREKRLYKEKSGSVEKKQIALPSLLALGGEGCGVMT